MKKTYVIAGLALLIYSVSGRIFGNLAVQELGGQTNTEFFSEELKLDIKQSNTVGQYFALLSISAIWLFVFGVPILLYGFNIAKKYCMIAGIGIPIPIGVVYVSAIMFYAAT